MLKFSAAVLGILSITASHANACVGIEAVGVPPYTAEDYVLPLSLRANLVFLVKRELQSSGLYAHEIDHTYAVRLADRVREMQEDTGAPVTGCLTWEIVFSLDPQNRKPPEW